jgi:hypothetical protein
MPEPQDDIFTRLEQLKFFDALPRAQCRQLLASGFNLIGPQPSLPWGRAFAVKSIPRESTALG